MKKDARNSKTKQASLNFVTQWKGLWNKRLKMGVKKGRFKTVTRAMAMAKTIN